MLGFLVPFQAILLSLFEVMQALYLLDSLPGFGGGLGQSCLDHQSRNLYLAIPIVRIR